MVLVEQRVSITHACWFYCSVQNQEGIVTMLAKRKCVDPPACRDQLNHFILIDGCIMVTEVYVTLLVQIAPSKYTGCIACKSSCKNYIWCCSIVTDQQLQLIHKDLSWVGLFLNWLFIAKSGSLSLLQKHIHNGSEDISECEVVLSVKLKSDDHITSFGYRNAAIHILLP